METNRGSVLRCWMQALCAATLLCIAILGFGRVGLLIDDVIIMRALSGFSGVYPDFLPFNHSLVVKPLVWLHGHFSSIHWYSWMLLGCFYFALAVILKCMLQRSPEGKRLMTVLLWLAAFVLLWLSQSLELNYTNVSTLLGCAALAQLCSFDVQKTKPVQMVAAVGFAAVLASWGYGLRRDNLYPILGFCGLAALFQLSSFSLDEGLWRKQARRFLGCLLIPIACLALLTGWRIWECNLPENQKIDRWNQVRIQVMDYLGMDHLPDSLLKELGWTEIEAETFEKWFFLDNSVDTQAFEKILAYKQDELQKENLWQRIATAQQTFWRFFGDHPTLLLAVGLMGCCTILLFSGQNRYKKGFAVLSLVASYLLIFYLAFRGRFLMRAVLAVMGPEMTLLLMMSADEDEPCTRFRHLQGKCLSSLLLAALIATGFVLQAGQLKFETSFFPLRSYRYRNSWSLIDEYAAQNPETLFVVDTMADDRLFPDMMEGRVTNVLYFGGWQARDHDFESQLRRFGIDPEHMDGRLFLQDNVCLVSLSTEYAQRIQEYIQSLCEQPVVVETVDTFKENYWVRIIRFHLE